LWAFFFLGLGGVGAGCVWVADGCGRVVEAVDVAAPILRDQVAAFLEREARLVVAELAGDGPRTLTTVSAMRARVLRTRISWRHSCSRCRTP